MTDIHIIAPFVDANGGDWRAIDLYLALRKKNNVQLWSPQPPNQAMMAQYPINEIKPYQAKFPASGTVYVVGASTEIGSWYKQTHFGNVILIHNLFLPHILYKTLNYLTLDGTRKVEVQYASKMIRDSIGLPGKIAYPFPHPERFQPLARIPGSRERFTVGRSSRDSMSKHHFSDPDFYRRLVAHDMQVKIVGGTCLRPWLEDVPNIELLSEAPQPQVPDILDTLDCFYYRTSIGWKEAFGIVVVEAMLCGLPVVCHRQGGYAEIIEHAVNGFLFDTEEEAFEIISRLKSDAGLRQAVSNEARLINYRGPDEGEGTLSA